MCHSEGDIEQTLHGRAEWAQRSVTLTLPFCDLSGHVTGYTVPQPFTASRHLGRQQTARWAQRSRRIRNTGSLAKLGNGWTRYHAAVTTGSAHLNWTARLSTSPPSRHCQRLGPQGQQGARGASPGARQPRTRLCSLRFPSLSLFGYSSSQAYLPGSLSISPLPFSPRFLLSPDVYSPSRAAAPLCVRAHPHTLFIFYTVSIVPVCLYTQTPCVPAACGPRCSRTLSRLVARSRRL